MRLLLIICFALIVGVSQAQSAKKKKASSDSPRNSDNTLEPYYPKNSYQPSRKKSSKKKDEGPSYDSEKEYFARLEQLEKTRQKNERLMEKPQYSDHSYFGHKRPPKKRSVRKMKFCKECGIRHWKIWTLLLQEAFFIWFKYVSRQRWDFMMLHVTCQNEYFVFHWTHQS